MLVRFIRPAAPRQLIVDRDLCDLESLNFAVAWCEAISVAGTQLKQTENWILKKPKFTKPHPATDFNNKKNNKTVKMLKRKWSCFSMWKSKICEKCTICTVKLRKIPVKSQEHERNHRDCLKSWCNATLPNLHKSLKSWIASETGTSQKKALLECTQALHDFLLSALKYLINLLIVSSILLMIVSNKFNWAVYLNSNPRV